MLKSIACVPIDMISHNSREVSVMSYLDCLPKRDLAALLEIASESCKAKSSQDFRACFNKLKSMMVCDGGFCIYADKEALDNHEVPVYYYDSIDFSDEFITQYIEGRYHENSAVIRTLYNTWEPQNWQSSWSTNMDRYSVSSMQLAKEFGYMDGWTQLIRHTNNLTLSAISFAGKRVERDQRAKAIMKYIIPHLAESLKSVFNSRLTQVRESTRLNVTARELEILKWVEKGKTNWDISMILSCSERVVKWHVGNLMRKLNALNRTHAVAIGFQHGLLD